jgi:hypothetical protein
MKFSKERDLRRKNKSKRLGHTGLPDIERIQTVEGERGVRHTSPSFKRKIIETSRLTDSDLSLPQRIKLRLFGQAYIGNRIREEWKGPLPFYVFRCHIHGLVEDYPHGYSDRLDCPRCLREERLLRELIG